MGRGSARDAFRGRTWAALGISSLLLLGGFFEGPGVPPTAPPALQPPAVGSFSNGQLAQAGASLAGGHGPGAAGTPRVSAAAGPLYRWSNLTGLVAPGPSPRASMMTWDGADGYVLLFGGVAIHNGNTSLLGDTWTFLNGTWRNITAQVTGGPPPMCFGSMAYDPPDASVILFGGVSNGLNTFLNATWSYKSGTWTNVSGLSGAAPSPRIVPGFTYDSSAQELLLSGGFYQNDSPTPGTWVYRGSTWTNVTAASVIDPHIYLPALADDPPDQGVLMTSIDIEGHGTAGPYAEETFLYQNGTWHNLTGTLTQEPPTLYVPAMIFVPAAGGVFDISGAVVNSSGYFLGLAVTWEFVAGAWRNLTTTSGAQPVSGIEPAVAVDPSDNALLTFGRARPSDSETLGDTWALAAVPSVSVAVSSTHVDVGTTVNLTGSLSLGIRPFGVQWDLGDGSQSSSLALAHAYGSPGLFLATLSATDFEGQSNRASVAIAVAAVPQVAIVVDPSSPIAGSPASVYALVTGGSPPFSDSWTFGDGGTGTGPVVSHTYTGARTVHVWLNVTDAAGVRVAAQANVTVFPAGSGTSNGGSSSTSSVGGIPLLDLALLLGLAAALGVVGYAVGHRRGKTPPPPPMSGSVRPYDGVPGGASGLPPPPPAPPS